MSGIIKDARIDNGRAPILIAWGPSTLRGWIEIGFDVKIRLIPSPWLMPKIQFFEALAEISGAGLTKFEEGRALSVFVRVMEAEPEHDEGGWIENHTPGNS